MQQVRTVAFVRLLEPGLLQWQPRKQEQLAGSFHLQFVAKGFL